MAKHTRARSISTDFAVVGAGQRVPVGMIRRALSLPVGLITAMTLACGMGVADPGSRERSGFCSGAQVGLESNLPQLPPITEVPRSGKLPFGPPTIWIWEWTSPRSGRQVIATGRSYGLLIGGSYSGVIVNWNVESKLTRVGSNGLEEVVNTASGFLGSVDSRSEGTYLLRVPSLPGVYRYDISFSTETGLLLGSYSSYIRAVSPRLGASLAVKQKVLRPGGTLRVRVENRGTELLHYFYGYEIQRRVGATWQYVFSGPDGRVPKNQPNVLPSVASECQEIPLPPSLPPGRYRVVKEIRRGQPEGRLRMRTAEFRLTSLRSRNGAG
jgi:hypothetical protein